MSSPLLELKSLKFAYPDGRQVLDVENFSVNRGEFSVLCGRSGCGKSTLLRLLKPSLAPSGELSGEILLDKAPIMSLDRRAEAARIGFVLQSPDAQSVTDKVWHELAFGLESLGLENSEIHRRVDECVEFFGLGELFYKNIAELSGGQKQRINLAAVMSMRPELLILDEPTSQLDPTAASALLCELKRINRELGTTIILAEHRLEEALTLADRVAVMENGRIVVDCRPREAASRLCAIGETCREFHPMLAAMPTAARVFAIYDAQNRQTDDNPPLTVDEGRERLARLTADSALVRACSEKIRSTAESTDSVRLTLDAVSYSYENNKIDAVESVSLTLNSSEITAIIGANGSGKSTLLKLAAGIYKPHSGSVERFARLVYLPQDPQTLFIKSSVGAELGHAAHEPEKALDHITRERLDAIIRDCRLSQLLDRHPYDLSGGEIQRAALAKLLLLEPEIILMDEPTKGLDALSRREFAEILSELRERGKTVLLVTHDMELCAQVADKCALMVNGRISRLGSAGEIFELEDGYTTAASRMSREIISGAITSGDILSALGCAENYRKADEQAPITLADTPENAGLSTAFAAQNDIREKNRSCNKSSKLSAKALLGVAILLLAIPLTLLGGIYLLDSSQYYITSMLVLLECMIPFFLIFEARKPKARELVLLAALCALGVAGRAALFMAPQLKPVAALAIITGVSLGAQSGFLVGAVTMLASNMMFSQGPWTPFQMFAMGLVGFFAGVLFGAKSKPSKIALAVYGFVSSVVLWGGIMNPASAFMWVKNPSPGVILAYIATGLPLDVIQGLATAVFLLLAAEPMLEKLERIRVKYGMLE